MEAVREGEAYSLNEELVEFYGCDRDEIPGDEMLMRAKKLSDTAIVFLTRAAGENQDASTAKRGILSERGMKKHLLQNNGYICKDNCDFKCRISD